MRDQRGVTLIEILVTLLVTAIGLLGLASMQLVNLKNINNSQYRTQATILAYSMAEKMRSNQAGVSNGSYDDIDGDESDPACSPCTVDQIARLDAYKWNQLIDASAENGGLPEGAKGTVTVRGNGLYDIVVSWEEQTRSSQGGGIEQKNLTLTVRI